MIFRELLKVPASKISCMLAFHATFSFTVGDTNLPMMNSKLYSGTADHELNVQCNTGWLLRSQRLANGLPCH